MSKLRVGILFGGRTTEHEVSIASATNVLQALDLTRYTPVLIGVDHAGNWHVAEPDLELVPEAVIGGSGVERAYPSLRGALELHGKEGRNVLDAPLDVVFPIIHGRGGEDGTLQGLLELADIPYVGAGVAATALCMDKSLSKAVLRDSQIPVLPSLEAPREQLLVDDEEFLDEVEDAFPYPVFVKPTNTGSSVGVQRAQTRAQLHQGIKEAARYDHEVLVEPGLKAREVECAVLGGHHPEASVLGEIAFASEFYDYEAKYASDSTELIIPARLSTELAEEIRALAIGAFEATKCWGMARVDFFLDEDDEIYVNELNTLPGFTDGSMYPRLWEASGLAPHELVNHLLELALERHRERASLEIRFRS